jgi:hypothetical protein
LRAEAEGAEPPHGRFGARWLTPEVKCISIRIGEIRAPSAFRSGTVGSRRRWLFGIAVVMLWFFVAPTTDAAPQAPDREIPFDIPAQPLDAALEAYIQATGLQVLYKSALVTSRNSSPVKGQFTPQNAIEKLLAGTNLTVRYTADGAFTISPVEAMRDRTPFAQSVIDYDAFLGRAQQRIIASLCRNTTTRPGSYRAVLQFSIGPAGLIDGAALLGSTGDETRDHLVPDVLRGLTIGQAPPPDMPQPITMLIVPRRPGFQDECLRFSQ